MYFLQIAQSTIQLRLGRKLLLTVPKFEIDEAIAWGSEILQQEIETKTKDMDDVRRAEFLNLYPQLTPDLNSMRGYLRTVEGVKKVITTCLLKAKVQKILKENKDGKVLKAEDIDPLTPEMVEEYVKVNGTGRLGGLAWVLADIDDQSVMRPPDGYDGPVDEDSSQREESPDPLSGTVSTGSKSSAGTGQKK